MPELPEVEAVIRKLRKAATGARIAAFQALRPRATHPQDPAVVEAAVGCTIRSFERQGKHILVRLDKGLSLDVHLKLSGNLTVIPDARLHTDAVRALFTLKGGSGLALEDRRVLAYVHLHPNTELDNKLAHLGIDPLSPAFTPEFLASAAKDRNKPAKVFLMDQKPIAGLGNIYSAEALFRARVHPATPIGKLRRPRIHSLHDAIRVVLKEAIPAAVRSYKHPGLHEGMNYFVYDREGEQCRICRCAVKRIEQAGRSTYFCPNCQKRSAL